MSENELVKVEDLEGLGGTLERYSDEDFNATSTSATYLPRFQLLTSNSAKCKSGEFPTNHYAIISDQNHVDLGQNVDVLLITWRPKALEVGENIITVYEPSSEDFQRIQDRSLNVKDSGCMFGPEFLIWIPSVKKFATLFMGTKSSRREAGNVKARMQKSATFGSQKIETKKFTWYAPQVSACSTPFEMPVKTELLAVVEQFNNPPESDIQAVSESETEERAR